MSNHSISIVPRQSSYPESKIKAEEILDWLTSKDIIKPTLSGCVLSSAHGYAISEGARHVTKFPDQLPFGLISNGLDIVNKRQVFHTGENGMDECVCPNCEKNIASEDWSFFNDWYEQKSDSLTCPLCGVANDIHLFTFSPEWGFSNLGFTFWNWSDLTDEFVDEFKLKLGCAVSIVYTHI
jgi:hypothetical protein